MSLVKGRVLIIVENLSVPFDRRVWREARSLKDAGYQVSVISPKGQDRDTKSRELIEDIAVYRYRPFEANTPSALAYILEYGQALIMESWLMAGVWLKRGFDVVQICNPPDLLFLATLPYRLLLGKKVIFDHHDLWPELYISKREGRPPGKLHKVFLWFERQTFRFSDIVMSTNASYREIAISRGKVAPENVFIVRNGPELSRLRAAKPNPALRGGKARLLVYVGMMGNQDGVDYLLRAVKHLRDVFGRRDFRLLLLGDGSAYDGLRAYAHELGLDEEVAFTGRVEQDTVFEAIATADVCVCPDPNIGLNDKSTLVKVLEYMSLGKPVVAFDLIETRASAGEAAVYAEPNREADFAEKIDALLRDPAECERRGAIGRERILNELAWDHTQAHLLAAYAAAFRKAGKPAE